MSDDENIQAQLAALADGTLPAHEREQVLAQIARSPELAAQLERQRHAVALLGSLEDLHAPPALHASVASRVGEGTDVGIGEREQRTGDSTGRRRKRAPLNRGHLTAGPPREPLRLRLAGIGALAAVAAVTVILALTAGGTSQPTVTQAARLALAVATSASPSESSHNHDVLDSAVEGITYPYWQSNFGWRAAGARTDRIAGRTVRTVFYTRVGRATGSGDASSGANRRIGYAIVSGPALALPSGTVVNRAGVPFHVLTADDGATIVTWRRAGHTCILAARGVGGATLVRLASWE